MKFIKIITICGSLKFQKEMMEEAQRLAFEGNCVLTPIYPVPINFKVTSEILSLLKVAHKERIRMSDAIFVINKDGYIGDSTILEIEYAKSLHKEIDYYVDVLN